MFASPTDDFNLWQAAIGDDQGGDSPGAPGLPPGPGHGPAQGRRNKRQTLLFAELTTTFIKDEKIRNMLLAIPEGDQPAPAPLIGFRGIGRRAWLLIISQGAAPIDDEYIQRVLAIFTNCDIISTVGYKVGTVADFHRYLTNLTFLVPAAQQPGDDQLAVKIMTALGKESPDALALEAVKEVKAAAADRRFVLPGGGRDLPTILMYFSEMYDHQVRNKKISERTAPTRLPSSSALTSELDQENPQVQHDDAALAASASDEIQHDEPPIEDISNEEAYTISEWNAFVASQRGRARGPVPVHLEPVCDVCKGLGHFGRNCASKANSERTLAVAHSRLGRLIENGDPRAQAAPGGGEAQLAAQQQQQPQQQRRFVRRSPSPNGPRPRAAVRRPPYGSLPNNAHRRVSFFNRNNANVADAPEADAEEDETEELCTDVDIFCARVTRSTGMSSAACPISQSSAACPISQSTAGSAPAPMLTAPVKAVKIIVFHVDSYNEASMLVHTRNESRGGNLDVNGVMMLPGEELIDSARRCVQNEFDDNPVVRDAVLEALDNYPSGHHTIVMNCYGVPNEVTLIAAHVVAGTTGRLTEQVSPVWLASRTMANSLRWDHATTIYCELIPQKYSLAKGMRQALVAAGCAGTAVPTSPRGFVSELNGDSDQGRLRALIITGDSSLRLRGGANAQYTEAHELWRIEWTSVHDRTVDRELNDAVAAALLRSPYKRWAVMLTKRPVAWHHRFMPENAWRCEAERYAQFIKLHAPQPPLECIDDSVTHVAAAAGGKGLGLFASRDIEPGEMVARFGYGCVLLESNWEKWRRDRKMPHDSAFDSLRGQQMQRKVRIFDWSWQSSDDRPKWYYINHSKYRCNAYAVKGRWGDVVFWFATKHIAAGEEITYNYGPGTEEWDEAESIRLFNTGATRAGTLLNSSVDGSSAVTNNVTSDGQPSGSQNALTVQTSTIADIPAELFSKISLNAPDVLENLRLVNIDTAQIIRLEYLRVAHSMLQGKIGALKHVCWFLRVDRAYLPRGMYRLPNNRGRMPFELSSLSAINHALRYELVYRALPPDRRNPVVHLRQEVHDRCIIVAISQERQSTSPPTSLGETSAWFLPRNRICMGSGHIHHDFRNEEQLKATCTAFDTTAVRMYIGAWRCEMQMYFGRIQSERAMKHHACIFGSLERQVNINKIVHMRLSLRRINRAVREFKWRKILRSQYLAWYSWRYETAMQHRRIRAKKVIASHVYRWYCNWPHMRMPDVRIMPVHATYGGEMFEVMRFIDCGITYRGCAITWSRVRQSKVKAAQCIQRAARAKLLAMRLRKCADINHLYTMHARAAAREYLDKYFIAGYDNLYKPQYFSSPIYHLRASQPRPPAHAYVFNVERTGGNTDIALSASDRSWVETYAARQSAWEEWIVDCGATKHVTNNLQELTRAWPTKASDPPCVRVGNGQRLKITHIGEIDLSTATSPPIAVRLTDVLVVPDMGPKLFSCGAGFVRDGIRTHLNERAELETANGQRIPFSDSPAHYSFWARPMSQGVQIHEEVNFSSAYALETFVSNAEQLHQRLGHFSLNRIISARDRSIGLELDHLHHHDPLKCEACLLNSKRAATRRTSAAQAGQLPKYTYFGQCVQSDLIKMLESAPHEFLYGMIFNDRASNWLDFRFTKDKEPESVLSGLQSWTLDFDRELCANGGLREWHTDNGGEFRSNDIQEFCNELSARHSRTVPETPQDNAGAERGNGIALRQTRILLAAANLSDKLWPYAFKYVCFVHNSLPTRAHSPPISPYEFVYGRLPNLSLIHTFGCKCYVPLSESEQEKFVKSAPTSVAAVHLGFDRSTGGFHVYVPELRQFTVAHGVRFIEDEYFAPPELKRNETYAKRPKRQKEGESTVEHEVTGGTRTMARSDVPSPEEENGDVTFASNYLDEPVALSLAQLANSNIPSWCLNPKTYAEATHKDNPLAPWWRRSMDAEIEGKMQNGPNGFAKPVPTSEAARNHRRPIKVKWVFKAKMDIDGSVQELKARIVGKGFVQRQGLDYDETFASTIRAATVRTFFAVVAKHDMELALADVVKAFTQAEIDRLIYIDMPEGYEQDGYCLQLNMSLEGMKQSAHLWQKLLADVLTSKLGFTRSLIDPCLYTKRYPNDVRVIMIVWVDDIAIGHNSPKIVRELMAEMQRHIKCTYEETLKRFLGIEITRDRKHRTITLTQSSYLTKMFEQHLSAANSKSWKHVTPCGTSKEDARRFMDIEPTSNQVERETNINRGYLALIGATMYAMVFTRPDVAYHVSALAKCMQSPSTEAYEALLNVMHYLYHTRHLGITFGPADPNRIRDCTVETSEPRVWHDASFGGRDFTPYGGGYIEYYYGPVTWVARKLKFVPLSTCEAEVGAMVGMAKEVMFVRHILIDMFEIIRGPTIMVTDSKSANDTVVNAGATKHTVHFERWLHFARSLQLQNKIKSVLVTTELMRADDKTKVVDKKKFMMCRREIMNLRADVKDTV